MLGVSDEDIARDYSLTRIGLEPIREILNEQFKDFMAAYPKAALALASSEYVPPHFRWRKSLTRLSASSMHEFLHLLRTKYGSSRAYFVKEAGFTDEELDVLCERLVVTAPSE